MKLTWCLFTLNMNENNKNFKVSDYLTFIKKGDISY